MKELIEFLETDEQKNIAYKVLKQVRMRIEFNNYFGWRSFIDDLLNDLLGYMIADKFAHSVSGYINCGMQSAIDHCRYCNAKKRRGDYETANIDDFYSLADDRQNLSKAVEDEEACKELYDNICAKFGEALANQLKPLIYGEADKLDRKLSKQCKTEEFKEFLTGLTR